MSSSTRVEGINPPIIGVGASAGGLEAFSQLLQHLSPQSQLSFVLVQHLSPRHESALPALLAARTHLQVVPVTDGIPIEPGHVYVIPPNVQITAEDRHLNVEPRPLTRSQYTPIDRFFQSLAKSEQNRALGIILSGTASDGAVGLREIKAAGGITIVQRPETAKDDGMPRAALATGMVDLSLSPSEIADHLSYIEQHPYVAPAEKWPIVEKAGPSDAQLDEILTLLQRASGVNFKQYKPTTVKRRLLRRMALARVADVIDYVQYLHEHQQEVLALHRDLLIHVTRFFRDPESFDALAGARLPAPREQVRRRWDAPHLGPRLRKRRGGVQRRHRAHGISRQSPFRRTRADLRDRRQRDRDRAGARRPLSALDRGRCLAGAAGAVLREDGQRIQDRQDATRLVHLRAPRSHARPAVLAPRSGGLPERPDLPGARASKAPDLERFTTRSIQLACLMLGPAETTGYQHLFTVLDKKWRLYEKATIDAELPVAVSSRARHLCRAAPQPGPPRVRDRAISLRTKRRG